MTQQPAMSDRTLVRRHLADARFHLRNAGRSIDAARDHARKQDSDRELAQLDRFTRLARSMLTTVARREIRGLRWP